VRRRADQAADLQLDQHTAARHRKIGQPSHVPGVHPS
jgi:hypothetical protein